VAQPPGGRQRLHRRARHAGLFLPGGYLEIAKLLATKAEQGTRVRLTLGDPDPDAVWRRGEEQQIGDGLAARVRLGLLCLLVNAHVYGAPAAHWPVLHLCRLPGGQLIDHDQVSFERVWEQASADNLPAGLAQGERR
jgi:hypothetical protein